MPEKRKIFYGWWIVLGAALMQFFGAGTFYYGFTVFFSPIRNTFGWTAAATSIAFTLQRLESGILGPVAGFLVDKLGPRKLMLAGWCVVVLGFLLMSRINSLWPFYGTFLVVAMGMSFASGIVINTAVANWFNKNRSRSLTLAYLGPGICGILAPSLALLIGKFGWRETLIFVAITILVICLPLSLLFRHKPSQYGYLPDGETPAARYQPASVPNPESPSRIARQGSDFSVRDFTAKEAMRTRAFWLLCSVSFFQQVGNSALMVHIVPYLESVKVPSTIAATAVTGMTLCSLIGRVGCGWLGDYANKRYLITIALGLQCVGLFIFSLVTMDKAWLILVFLLTYGPGYGGPIPVRPALQADYFGTRSFGTIMGLMSLITMIGGLASPTIAGWLFDVTGSYRLAWQTFTLVTLPAIPLMLLAKSPKAKQAP